MADSPFTPNLARLDWSKIAGHLAGIAKCVAETTPSPLDDIVADQLGIVLADFLKTRLQHAQAGVMMAGTPDSKVEAAHAALAAKGVAVDRPFLKKLLELALQLLPLLL